MAKTLELLQVTDAEKNAFLKHYEISEEDMNEKINHLADWHQKSGLPYEDVLRSKLRICLINNKMSTERAKKSIKAYYYLRTRYRGFFEDLMPGTEFFENGKKYMKSVVLPRLTSDLCRVHIVKFTDPHAEAANGFIYEVTSFMHTELRIKCGHEFFLSNVLIVDLEDFTLRNMLKYTPTINTQLVNIMVALNLRIKNIHFVNLSPIMDKIMVLLKSLLPTKFYNRVVIHHNFDTLYDYIGKELLPAEYGGTSSSIQELHEKWLDLIQEEKEYFEDLAQIKYDLSPDEKDTYEIIGSGMEGSFKKLNID